MLLLALESGYQRTNYQRNDNICITPFHENQSYNFENSTAINSEFSQPDFDCLARYPVPKEKGR